MSCERFALEGLSGNEVWLTPRYTRRWEAEEAVTVTIPLA